MQIIKKPLIFFILNSIFIYICVRIAPSFYGDLNVDYDSENYILSAQNRLSLYPLIINSFDGNFNFLINFQIFIFSLSLSYLVMKVKKKG